MKILKSLITNILGIIFFLALIFFLSLFFDYLSPKLITLGWTAYLGLVLVGSVVSTILTLIGYAILFPLIYLITTKTAKILCVILTIIGFIYSVSTSWQYANIIGYSFIVIIWCITLTFFIVGLYYLILMGVFISPEKRNNR